MILYSSVKQLGKFNKNIDLHFSSVTQLCPTLLQTHGLQHARPPCPSPTPGVYLDSCPLSWWCHPAISSSVVPFSSSLQYFPTSGSFQMSQFFKSGGQSIGVSASASVLPMNISNIYFSYEIQSLLHLLLEECVNDSLYSSVKQLGKFNKNIDLLLA